MSCDFLTFVEHRKLKFCVPRGFAKSCWHGTAIPQKSAKCLCGIAIDRPIAGGDHAPARVHVLTVVTSLYTAYQMAAIVLRQYPKVLAIAMSEIWRAVTKIISRQVVRIHFSVDVK
jgi:hypothetical protein